MLRPAGLHRYAAILREAAVLPLPVRKILAAEQVVGILRGFRRHIDDRERRDHDVHAERPAPREVAREDAADPRSERAGAATQEDRASQRESLALLQETLDRLDPGQRDVFVLYELEGLDMTDVASAVGCPLQTAYSRLHAARKFVVAAFAVMDEATMPAAARQRP